MAARLSAPDVWSVHSPSDRSPELEQLHLCKALGVLFATRTVVQLSSEQMAELIKRQVFNWILPPHVGMHLLYGGVQLNIKIKCLHTWHLLAVPSICAALHSHPVLYTTTCGRELPATVTAL